jgi:hypothetical protein
VTLNYLLDGHVLLALARGLEQRAREPTVRRLGDPEVPALHAPDPEVLRWCERHDFVLITKDRHSMPQHLADHVRSGGHVPGIFILNDRMSLSETITNLIEVAELSLEREYRDQIRYLPIL